VRFVPMKDLMTRAAAGGYAVPAFCVWGAETMATVLGVAQDLRAPVILMNGPMEFLLLSPADLAATANTIARRFDVPAAFHLDHGDSMEQVDAALAGGYTSVMLDYSARPHAENAAALREVVRKARPRGVTVEGEIGHVGKADHAAAEGAGASTLTVPAEAAAYAAETGVDALAVSIGNAHGQYTKLPRFDFDRLAAIRAAVPVPLVLHGGSGTPDEDIRRAIGLGIAKVNVATDLVRTIRESLREQWQAGRNLWLPAAHAEATRLIAPVVARWIERVGAARRA
jgi:ketose-bisphosphate aldolase